jgi:hypothetical protein
MIDNEFERLGREHQKSMEREARERKRREAMEAYRAACAREEQ